jgi:hypothetical protein
VLQELKIEVEECRADVSDLQKDLAIIQDSLKHQQSQTMNWKQSYDDEFKSHAVTQRTLADVRAELRECKDTSHALRAGQAYHPPAPAADVPDPTAGRGMAGPAGETQHVRQQAYDDSASQKLGAVSEDPPRRKHVLPEDHLDDDPMDRTHYHHLVRSTEHVSAVMLFCFMSIEFAWKNPWSHWSQLSYS